MWYSYHKTTSHNDVDCRVQQHRADGNARVAAARTQHVKGVCSAYDLSEKDNEPERPYISIMATEAQSKTEPATAPRQKNGTWPFGPLTAARPWLFVKHEKPAILLCVQDEPNLSYMYGETDSEGEPLYGTALMASGPAAFKHKLSAGDDSVTVLVDAEYLVITSTTSLSQPQASSAELRSSHYATQYSHFRRSFAGRHDRRDT